MTGKTILVVDDSPTDREFLASILKRHGYKVLMAENGAVAIQRAHADQPDLILMDVVMPGLNGFQATRAITQRETTRHIPIVICSSKNQDSDKTWGLRQGAKDYFTKPLDELEFLERIGAWFQ